MAHPFRTERLLAAQRRQFLAVGHQGFAVFETGAIEPKYTIVGATHE
jgi:hypothetical protein